LIQPRHNFKVRIEGKGAPRRWVSVLEFRLRPDVCNKTIAIGIYDRFDYDTSGGRRRRGVRGGDKRRTARGYGAATRRWPCSPARTPAATNGARKPRRHRRRRVRRGAVYPDPCVWRVALFSLVSLSPDAQPGGDLRGAHDQRDGSSEAAAARALTKARDRRTKRYV
jgi:hypothetical protein